MSTFVASSGKPKQRKSVSFETPNLDEEEPELPVPSTFQSPIKHSISLIPFHLPLLGAYLYAGLLKNPANALIYGIPTLIATQAVYGVLITRQFKNVSGSSKGKAKKSSNSENIPLLIIGSLVISLLLSMPTFLGIVLFGAPLYGLLLETYLLSIHLSLVIFFPILVSYKLDIQGFLRNYTPGGGDKIYPLLYKDQLILAAIGAVLGAWFGVLPIPLDWDREWQQWPITILLGGYAGYFVGNVVSLPLK